MSKQAARGDGVGLEIAHSLVRGVRLRHDVDGRLAAAVELPLNLADDAAVLDTLVLLRAELGEPNDPTRIATFPGDAMLQRIDVTGHGGPELNELRATFDRRHGITSTVIVDDGPRRWLLLIRWDSNAARRLENLAERAGFVDVTVEPSPMALARVAGTQATSLRRLVAQGDSHQMVANNRIPVAALAVSTTGRNYPDVDLSNTPTALEHFDEYLSSAALGDALDRVMERSFPPATPIQPLALDIAGDPYPSFPEHDHRSAQRQGVALGAAVGASGLAGPLRVVDMIFTPSATTGADSVDRPWAIETLSALPDVEPEAATGGMKRMTRRFRPRKRR